MAEYRRGKDCRQSIIQTLAKQIQCAGARQLEKEGVLSHFLFSMCCFFGLFGAVFLLKNNIKKIQNITKMREIAIAQTLTYTNTQALTTKK